jgi:hypothetical protein
LLLRQQECFVFHTYFKIYGVWSNIIDYLIFGGKNMVKIYGLSAKIMETWTGRDGYGIIADIYKGRTKLGTYRDDGDGSEPDFSGDVKTVRECADKYFAKYPPNLEGANIPAGKTAKEHLSFCFNEIAFIEELLALVEDEKLVRKKKKEGYKVIVMTKYPTFAKGPRPIPFYGQFRSENAEDDARKWIARTKKEWPLMEFVIHKDLSLFKIE